MNRILTLAVAASILTGCAGPQYKPNQGARMPQNADPYPTCPAGYAVRCDWEGGVLVGKRITNCRCAH